MNDYYEIYRTMGYSKSVAMAMAKRTAERLDGISGREKMRILLDGE